MTTELEKQFFDTFGIEPREYCERIYQDGCFKNCPLYPVRKTDECFKYIEAYPEITDRILLELICICSQYGFCPTSKNIKDLKLKVLKRLFELKENLKNNYEHQGCHNAFARKVRTLFKEAR